MKVAGDRTDGVRLVLSGDHAATGSLCGIP